MLRIEFREADWNRYKRALHRIFPTVIKVNIDMQKTCAMEYKQLVAFNIMTQKYGFRAHSKKYREWKQSKFPEYPAFWRLHGDVLRNLSAFPHSDGDMSIHTIGFMGGIPSGRMGSTGQYVAYYATKVEEGWIAKGGKPRPARRMFWKTKEDYKKSPTGWLKNGEIALGKVGNVWR